MRATVLFLIILIYLSLAECKCNNEQTKRNVTNLQDIVNGVYEGAVARLYCRIKGEVTWMYAKCLKNDSFTRVVQKDRVVIQNRSMSIYRSTKEDAGVYRCQTRERSGLVVLEVVNDDAYTVVKHSNMNTSLSFQSIGQELSVFTVWSQWSECRACGKAGRRRRFGMCYVKLNNMAYSEKKNHQNSSSLFSTILQVFPEGVPCRSRRLPDEIRNSLTARNTTNEIMISICKVQCKAEIFVLRSSSGIILETANNTEGIYSLRQPLPPQPPTPTRNILFVGRGQRVLVKCPGTTLRDIPVTWRAGDMLVEPGVLRESSGGRVHVDARDHVVIARVLYEDANLYSCWEGDNLAGTVKLVVWAGAQVQWNHHTVLVAIFILGAVLLHIALRLL